MGTVPVFAPDGTLGDIPTDQLQAAVKAGAKPGVNFKAPDGATGVIPADQIQNAYKAGGKLVPFEQQETDHPGFWGAVKSYFDQPFDPMHPKFPERNIQMPTAEENAQRKAQGYGPTYRALAPVAESLAGMNVKGAEHAASQGDVGGVLGYAAVPAALAVAPLVGEAAIKAGKVVAGPAATPRVQAAPKPTASVYRDATLTRTNVPEYAGEDLGPVAAQPSANLPPVKEPIDLGKSGGPLKASDFAAKPAAPTNLINPALKQAEALKQPVHDIVDEAIPPSGPTKGVNLETKAKIDFHLQRGDVEGAQSALDQVKGSLRDELGKLGPQSTRSVQPTIKNGDLYDYRNGQFLKNGKVLDKGADIADAVDILENQPHQKVIEGEVTSPGAKTLQPPQFPPQAPKIVPSVQNIRENDAMVRAAQAQPGPKAADALDDRATQQEMQWNLEKHGYQAESEARREFIARNSTGATKGDLIRQAGGTVPEKPVIYTKTPGVNAGPPAGTTIPGEEDMTQLLQDSLKQAQLQKQAGAKMGAIQEGLAKKVPVSGASEEDVSSYPVGTRVELKPNLDTFGQEGSTGKVVGTVSGGARYPDRTMLDIQHDEEGYRTHLLPEHTLGPNVLSGKPTRQSIDRTTGKSLKMVGPNTWTAPFSISDQSVKEGSLPFSAKIQRINDKALADLAESHPERKLVTAVNKGTGEWPYEFSFENIHTGYGGQDNARGITGTGHAAQIFRKTGEILQGVTSKLSPKVIYYTAVEPSRASLYEALTQRFGKLNDQYRAYKFALKGFSGAYALVRKESASAFTDAAKQTGIEVEVVSPHK